jgi:heme O synthase-like polyprenyltransferase
MSSTSTPQPSTARRLCARRRIISNSPSRVVLMVITAFVGFTRLGGCANYLRLLQMLFGTALTPAAAARLMSRTGHRRADGAHRRGRCRTGAARGRWFGIAMCCGQLSRAHGQFSGAVVTAFVAQLFGALPPMKRQLALHACWRAADRVPPVIGWVAARGSLDITAWVLFQSCFSGKCYIRWRSRSADYT